MSKGHPESMEGLGTHAGTRWAGRVPVRVRRSIVQVILAGVFLLSGREVRADVASGELYGYRLGEVVESCGREAGGQGWSRVATRDLPKPFDETWALCTPLTHAVLSLSARAHVDPAAGRTLVDELVALLQGKYGDKKGWKYAAQSRELLGTYDSLHSFENDAFLLRISTRESPGEEPARKTIVEVQLDRSTYEQVLDPNDQAEKERLEILRRSARAKGLDKGL